MQQEGFLRGFRRRCQPGGPRRKSLLKPWAKRGIMAPTPQPPSPPPSLRSNGRVIQIETSEGQLEEVALPPNIEDLRRQTLLERTRALLQEEADGTPAPSAEEIRNRLIHLHSQHRPHEKEDSPDSTPRDMPSRPQPDRSRGARSEEDFPSVRPYCPFPHRTLPPQSASLPGKRPSLPPTCQLSSLVDLAFCRRPVPALVGRTMTPGVVIRRRSGQTLGIHNLEEILNKAGHNGTQAANGMVRVDWGRMPLHLWCPFSLRVSLPLLHICGWLLTSLKMGEVPHPPTAFATADDYLSDGASRIGVDTVRSHLLALSGRPCHEQHHRAPILYSRSLRFGAGPPGGAPSFPMSRTFPLKVLGPLDHWPWPRPLAPEGSGTREDSGIRLHHSRVTSTNSRLGMTHRGLSGEIGVSVPGDLGSKTLWFSSVMPLLSVGNETSAQGVREIHLPPVPPDMCQKFVTVPLCENSVTIILGLYSNTKHLRPGMEGNPFNAGEPNSSYQIHFYQTSCSI